MPFSVVGLWAGGSTGHLAPVGRGDVQAGV